MSDLVSSDDYIGAPRAYWYQSIQVEQTDQIGPLTSAELRKGLEYGIWSWSQRTGKPITYAGLTDSNGEPTSGMITVTWVPWTDLPITAAALTTRWTYNNGKIAGAIIKLGEDYFQHGLTDCAQTIINHELGHALGIQGHSDNKHDVMYSQLTHCRYALTAADVQLAGYGSYTCHVELMRDGSAYVPDLLALLKRRGDIWTLESYQDRKTCDKTTTLGMDIFFQDVRAPDGIYSGWLQYGNEHWTLGQ